MMRWREQEESHSACSYQPQMDTRAGIDANKQSQDSSSLGITNLSPPYGILQKKVRKSYGGALHLLFGHHRKIFIFKMKAC